MDDERHWFEKFTLCMEQNIRGVKYGVYSIALVGLAVALRSVRPFKKFTLPQDIPASFVQKHLRLNGRVLRLEPPIGSVPPLLHVDHYPIISTSWFRPVSNTLPIQISSIDVSPNGLSWMQHIIVGSNIKFTILKVDPSSVNCMVTKDRTDVGLELVSLGFASVSAIDFVMEKDPTYLHYYKKLLAAENRAEKKGTGMWALDTTFSERLWRKLATHVSPTELVKQLWSKIRFSRTQPQPFVKT